MHALDASLTGCAVLFSCLDDELQNITRNRGNDGDLNLKGKSKAVWNHDRLEELLEGLHRQQSAINFLIQLVQLRSLENIMQALHQNRSTLTESIRRTKSLKESHPGVDVQESIFSPDDLHSLYSQDSSTSRATEQEFDFDDDIVNSKVYRRHLAALRKVTMKVAVPIVEGDLIDLSDSQTIIARQNEQMSQGRVKLAYDDNQELFAVKFIKSSNSSQAKICREAAILKGLSNPKIVHFCDTVQTFNYTGIVSDYAFNGELLDYVDDHKYLTDQEARRLFAQLVSRVGHMYRMGVVHRDLNFHHLFLDKNRNLIIGGFSQAEIFDTGDGRCAPFWASRLGRHLGKGIEDEDQRRKSLGKWYVCSRTCYVAPELVSNSSPCTDGQPDIWSCGIILYAMLSEHLPWNDDPANPDGDNGDLLYNYIASSPITFPDYVTPHARDLIIQMLVPDPRKRFGIYEVSRHSWLSEYSHMVESITREPPAPGSEAGEQNFDAIPI